MGVGVIVVCAAALVGTAGAAASERTVFGHSVEGRQLVAVHSGAADPAVTVLVVGAIHGNEAAGMPIARRLVAAGAPRGAELWVVPTLNPDGVAAGTRGNAHGVDLNRNFPFDWRPLGGGEYSGPQALSEPESRAGLRLIRRIQPDLTIWFHQPFGLVDASGNQPEVERRFADLAGLPLDHLRGPYPGSASRWQNHAFPDATAFVAELPAIVSPALTRRAATAVRTLAAELASPAVSGRRAKHSGVRRRGYI
ncbi:MAG TPA: M14 family zinc carboxypeptidase [Solirubrobacterales bacterium]|nr:M14 family zinc carboxypeptidase [Solirubrobacterales bacterium]